MLDTGKRFVRKNGHISSALRPDCAAEVSRLISCDVLWCISMFSCSILVPLGFELYLANALWSLLW